jgi:hypothetical protein
MIVKNFQSGFPNNSFGIEPIVFRHRFLPSFSGGLHVRRKVQLITLAVGVVFAAQLADFSHVSAVAQKSTIKFDREVRPILSDKCFACHGPDEKQRMAKLRLDTKEGAFAKQGVIVAGDPGGSRLIKRITSKDPNTIMPPPESGHKLTENEISLLRRWIEEGAEWNEHWAFVAPKRSEAPTVTNQTWVRNPIDAFIAARLEKENLKPSPEADRATLLRRVSLDLTGLPPTPAEVDAFLADKSPGAFEKTVDRLLASPRYGERMAMQWLDFARYADSHGYHIDSHRDMYPWRDWLIRAFNDNKRFDQFTVEMLAGDLLPNATLDQKIATGFNRNHMINFEGGAIPEEYLNEYIVDRVETTANTWLAMTMGCARCHSHKFDPISQKEFYQFYAFFNTVPEIGLDGRVGNAVPFLSLPTDEQKKQQNQLGAEIKTLTEALSDKNVQPLQDEWEKTLVGKTPVARTKDLAAHFDLDGSLADASGRYRNGRTLAGDPTFGPGVIARALSLDGQTQLGFGEFKDDAAFDGTKPFTFAIWLRPGLGKAGTFFFQKIENNESRRGFEMLFEETHLISIQRWAAPLTIRMTAKWPENGMVLRTKESFHTTEWKHFALVYDGSGKAGGVKVFVNGKPSEVEVLGDALNGPIKNSATLFLGDKSLGRAFSGSLDDLRIYNCALSPAEVEQLAMDYAVGTTLSGVSGKRTKEEIDRLRDYFLTRVAPQEMRRQYAELRDLRAKKTELDKSVLNTMVMQESMKPRETFVLARGDYRNKTDKVTPSVPAVLPPLPKDAPPNRLSLAKWLVDPNHPLTARVAVNRYWQMYFGHGLVKTSEDFGVQGEPPVNQELLDWLATEFIRTGWDVKALQRLIVTSAAYRQSSKVTPALLEKDPENRLLARGPRFRLPAETVRDNALAVSGLLDDRIGGPSVLPYQPPGIWEELAFGDGFSRQTYVQDHGRDLYRRSMYTFWKRTAPPAALQTFDAPDREKCVIRRAVTNTPLQALVLMNDPTYLEASRVLAQKAIASGGKEPAGRIAYLFRAATSRKPSAHEITVLRQLLTQQLANYRNDAKAAGELLKIGESPVETKSGRPDETAELAAWTMVTSAILNLDETITKE